MTKQSGLGDNLYVAGYNLSGDVGSLEAINGGVDALAVTGIDKSAVERLGGLRDGAIDFTAYFNDANDQEHEALASLSRNDRLATYCRGTALGSPAAVMNAKQIGYDPSRGEDGSLTEKVQLVADDFGLQWGNLLTPGVQTVPSGTTNGTGVDLAAATTFGLQAVLQVFAIVADINGTLDVKLQESSDNGVGDPWADVVGGAFAQINIGALPPRAERIATAAGLTVERYLRIVATSGGTFTSAQIAVAVVKNEVATVF